MYLKHKNGYTLLELMIVVLIIGILSAASVPSLTKFSKRMKLWAATDAIKKQLLVARMKALADPYKHCGVYFKLTPADSQSTVIFVEATVNNNTFNDPRTGGNDVRFLQEKFLPKGISMSFLTAPTNNVFIFRGDGSAKYSGKIVLTDGKGTRSLDVLASTGRIRLN